MAGARHSMCKLAFKDLSTLRITLFDNIDQRFKFVCRGIEIRISVDSTLCESDDSSCLKIKVYVLFKKKIIGGIFDFSTDKYGLEDSTYVSG
jgi:hypothetical protein